MPRGRLALFVAVVGLAGALAALAEPDVERARVHEALTEEERNAYGNRSDFFATLPNVFRPDLDWRSALSEAMREREPRWSQGFEELLILDFFAGRRDGVFLDVGCARPRRDSTTYALEDEFGWRGVGIDVMHRFRKPWETTRKRSRFVRAAVSDKDGEILTLHIAGPFATLEGELVEGYTERGQGRTVQVKTATLNSILASQEIESIDFLSIDIEGAELAALRGFDIERFAPALAAVETIHPEAVTEWFATHGYERIDRYRKADKINLYFRRPED